MDLPEVDPEALMQFIHYTGNRCADVLIQEAIESKHSNIKKSHHMASSDHVVPASNKKNEETALSIHSSAMRRVRLAMSSYSHSVTAVCYYLALSLFAELHPSRERKLPCNTLLSVLFSSTRQPCDVTRRPLGVRAL